MDLISFDSIKVVTGSEVFLECAANGIPQPSISWLKDGVALDPPTSDRLTLTGNGSLTIASARLSDAGGYQCRAENTEDVVDSGLEVQVEIVSFSLRFYICFGLNI